MSVGNLAVLVIDMQNGFCHPDGSLPRLDRAIPEVDTTTAEAGRLLATARARAVPVMFTRHVFRADRSDVPHRVAAIQPIGYDSLSAGSWDSQIVDELTPMPDELVVDKNRYDAFLRSDLEARLRSGDVRRLLVAGVRTNVCVESTVRSAEQLGFDCGVADDCTTSDAPAHRASLTAMTGLFATVAPWRTLLEEQMT